MAEHDQRERRGPLVGCLAVLLLALPAYVLSAGPAVWLAKRGHVSEETLNVIYAPILPLGTYAPALFKLWDSYLELWR